MGKKNVSKVSIDAVKKAQKKWAKAILEGNSKVASKLYADNKGNWYHESRSQTGQCGLAFNPTLDDNFLTTREQAYQYFEGTKEKPGFARKKWISVIFDEAKHPKAERFITLTSDGAVAVGRYIFERETVVLDSSGQEVLATVRLAVDYTFVYKDFNGKLKIISHHSSLPISQK